MALQRPDIMDRFRIGRDSSATVAPYIADFIKLIEISIALVAI